MIMSVLTKPHQQRISQISDTHSSGADGHVSGTVDYDVFGEPVTETGVFAGSAGGSGGVSALVFAYAGKPYDPVTGLSDYGFRDYVPGLARFTTVDPIRDGSNWYAYCNADPVNYVDMWGLSTSDKATSGTKNPYNTYTPFGITLSEGQSLEVNLSYQKNADNKLMVDVKTRNSDGTYDNSKTYSKTYENVTNNVKDYEEPVDFQRLYYYKPNQFPSGVWNITNVTISNNPDVTGPIKIWTDAHCTVTTYNEDGTEITGTAEDSGYQIHTGPFETTWGCIKMGSDEDIKELGTALYNVLAVGNNSVKLTVYD